LIQIPDGKILEQGTLVEKMQIDSYPTSQQELLLHACLAPPDKVDQFWQQWRKAADIDHLDGAANRLLPLLYYQLNIAGISDSEVPRLRGIYRYHWCRNQLLLSELRSILVALNDSDIPALLLKGTALIERYYHDPGLRPMSDIDLMVRPDYLSTAYIVLKKLGWLPKIKIDITTMLEKRVSHAILFVREKNGRQIELDLHWTPLPRATWPSAEKPFWEFAQKVQLNRIFCWTLDPTHQLLHICLHGGQWNQLPPYRWVADAFWILKSDSGALDWPRLLREAKRQNNFMALKSALIYLYDHFAAPIPDAVIKDLRHRKPTYFERLEFQILNKYINKPRIDQLLLREWFMHSRAFPDSSLLKKIIIFPAHIKNTRGLESWSQMPGYVLQQFCMRFGLSPDNRK